MAASTGLNEVKKLAKRTFLSDLEMKGTILVVRNVSTDKGVCDLKITVTAPAKGTVY